MFVGWLTPLVAIAGLVAIRRRRGLAVLLGLAALLPLPARPRRQPPGLRDPLAPVPGLDATRVPERFMPIACLALAALVAFAVDAGRTTLVLNRHKLVPPLVAAGVSCCWRSTCGCRCSAPSRPTRRTPPTRRSAGRAGCSSCPSSGRTSTTAASTSAMRGRARGSGRRATRRSRRSGRSGSRASSVPSPAAAGRFPPTSASVRRRPPRALRAERLLRARVRRPGRARAGRGRLAGARRRRDDHGLHPVRGGPPWRPSSSPYLLTRRRIRVVTLGPAMSPAEHPPASRSARSRPASILLGRVAFDRRPEVETRPATASACDRRSVAAAVRRQRTVRRHRRAPPAAAGHHVACRRHAMTATMRASSSPPPICA